MVKPVSREVIDELASLLKRGRLAYASIYAISSKKKTKYNVDYDEHKDRATDEVTKRHEDSIIVLYEFIEALEAGNVILFSFHKKGYNITYQSSYKEDNVSDTIVNLLEEASNLINNSDLYETKIDYGNFSLNLSDSLTLLIDSIKKRKE